MTKLAFIPALLCTLLLAGCSSDPGGSGLETSKQYKGVGRVVDQPSFDGTTHSVIYWLDVRKKAVSLTTWGSGSCPNIPVGLHVVSSTKVTLTIKTYSGPCTSDLAAYTSEFSLPTRASRSRTVLVSLDVPGRSAPEKLTLAATPAPSATSR